MTTAIYLVITIKHEVNMLNKKILNALKIAADYSAARAQDYLAGRRVQVSLGRRGNVTESPKSGKYLAMLPAFKKMSKRHKLFFKKLDTDNQKAYLKTFVGEYRSVRLSRTYFSRKNSGSVGPMDVLQKNKNKYLDMFKRVIDASASHSPQRGKFLGEMIGVEIECIIPCGSVNGMTSLAKHFETKKAKHTSVKHDGSISLGDLDDNGYFGAEIVVLDRIGSKDNLRRACEILNDLGATVNKSCGLHVHLDQRDLDGNKRRVSARAIRIGNTLEVLSTLVPESRRNNRYCQLAVSQYRGSRYYAVNKIAFNKYGTLEVRLHSSTTDFGKISNWIDLVYSISRCAGLSKNKVNTLDGLWDKIGLSPELKAYFESRQNKFSPNNPNRAQDDAA